jgi:hypothetical protein
MTYDFRSAAAEAFWPAASQALDKLQALRAVSLKKPTEANLRKVVNVAAKDQGISIWAAKCLAEDEDAAFLEPRRAIYRLSKNKQASLGELQAGLDAYLDAVRMVLMSAAPANFTYAGFKISNQERCSDKLCRQVLAGLDFLRVLFKKRGVVKLIDEDIKRVVLVPQETDYRGIAYFHSGTRELVISVAWILKGQASRLLDDLVNETLLHEFGHYVHRVYIKGEAEAAWNAPWEGVPSLANPNTRYMTDKEREQRKEQLDPLELVSEYGYTDQYEDFADTFVVFMAAPEKLSETAKFRMQRALSLSGLYGKPVMRLAAAVLARYHSTP